MLPVQAAIREVEPGVTLSAQDTTQTVDIYQAEQQELKRTLFRMGLAFSLFLIGLIFHDRLHATPYHWAEYAVMVPAYLLSGYPVLAGALRNLRSRHVLDEHFLMTIATLGAWIIHQVPEAVGVMIFYMFGEFLQDLSVNRSRRSIQALLAVKPDTANVMVGGEPHALPVGQVNVGDTILIRPGERVPLDAVIVRGSSQLDTSALTGEHVPRRLAEGDEVLAGMINQTEMLTAEVRRTAGDSAISRILDLVENASSRKAPTERFITRFARVYTPIVVALAAGIAVLPPMVLPGATFSEWLYRALVVLVISCPCALVVSIPLGYFGGVGAASRRGILVKGSNYLDVLAGVKTVIFDKTGTLTHGVFKVLDIKPTENGSSTDLLRLATIAETQSNHPIARSIRHAGAAAGLAPEISQPERYEEIAGQGVRVKANGNAILAGTDELMHREKITHTDCDLPGTIIHLAENGIYAGYIRVGDELKPDARKAIEDLRKIGVRRIWMLTGDRSEKAAWLQQELKLDGYQSGLLPEDKINALESLLEKSGATSGYTAYIGDGINDAPVLARADVGIAMGALGSQAAIETADVVIMSDAPSKVAEAIEIGRKTRTIVWQNILLALGIKALFILLGISGEASMWEAVFADMGVALLAILNAVRIIRA